MDTQKNIISTQAKLSALAGMMFFAPFVKNRTKSDSSLSEDDKDFIIGYTKVGYANLALLIITFLSAIVSFVLNYQIFQRVMNICSLGIYVISVVSAFLCVGGIGLRKSDESVVQNIPQKIQILKSFIPGWNFVLRFRQDSYNTPYRRLKESVFLWTIFIFGTLIFGNYVGIGIAAIIFIRILLLLCNVDIIPLNVKRTINSAFLCNPGEIMAYISAQIISKIKKSNYETALQMEKNKYAQGQTLGLGIIVQYVLFFVVIYFIHGGINSSMIQIVAGIAFVLWMVRLIVFYTYKKTFARIPILAEIVSIIFRK